VLAGFPDGRADEGVGAGPATVRGTRLARERGWTAPSFDVPADAGAAGDGAPAAGEPQSSAERPPTTPADTSAGTTTSSGGSSGGTSGAPAGGPGARSTTRRGSAAKRTPPEKES
jgi:NADH-quinone oxidoreductase subunit E